MASDDICLQLGKCVSLDFLYIDESSLPEDYDAIIGFARADKQFLLAPGTIKRPSI
jgi:hypothetical protein